jgi:hypothetical protein
MTYVPRRLYDPQTYLDNAHTTHRRNDQGPNLPGPSSRPVSGRCDDIDDDHQQSRCNSSKPSAVGIRPRGPSRE